MSGTATFETAPSVEERQSPVHTPLPITEINALSIIVQRTLLADNTKYQLPFCLSMCHFYDTYILTNAGQEAKYTRPLQPLVDALAVFSLTENMEITCPEALVNSKSNLNGEILRQGLILLLQKSGYTPSESFKRMLPSLKTFFKVADERLSPVEKFCHLELQKALKSHSSLEILATIPKILSTVGTSFGINWLKSNCPELLNIYLEEINPIFNHYLNAQQGCYQIKNKLPVEVQAPNQLATTIQENKVALMQKFLVNNQATLLPDKKWDILLCAVSCGTKEMIRVILDNIGIDWLTPRRLGVIMINLAANGQEDIITHILNTYHVILTPIQIREMINAALFNQHPDLAMLLCKKFDADLDRSTKVTICRCANFAQGRATAESIMHIFKINLPNAPQSR